MKHDKIAGGKVSALWLLKRGGKVYAEFISDRSSATLIPIIREKVVPDPIVYTDCFRGYNALNVSEFKHFKINHSELFAKNIIILMRLKIFGIKQKTCGSLMTYHKITSAYF